MSARSRTSRREFLLMSGYVAAAAGFGSGVHAWGDSTQGARSMQAWVTADTRRFAKFDVPAWRAADEKTEPAIQIDPRTWYQEILGFGGAFTDASCYMFSQLNAADRAALLRDLYGPDGLGFSVGRICIGSSDYTTSVYSFDESIDPDPELTRFSIDHDRAYILPTLRDARQLNPDLFLFSAPWSPPGWMKLNRSMLGGSMNRTYFASYSQYFVKFLESYAAAGVTVQATTIQNEVDTDQNGSMPACIWSQQDEVVFVKKYLGPALRAASLDTKIWILDHNYNLWGRVIDQLSDPDLCKYVDGVAWHIYEGTVDSISRVHNAFPSQNMHATEYGAVITSPDFETDWSEWSEIFTGVLRNWSRSIVGWNLALDEKGNPNNGPGQSGGIVTIHSGTQKITRCGQYWAFAHFSKVIQRGARVLSSTGALPSLSHVAITNPDGTHVLVLTNRAGLETQIPCRFEGMETLVTMPANSVVTIQW
jgi:glucosylceramidase